MADTPTTPPIPETQPTPAPAPEYDIELPACFYLGKEYDLAAKQVLNTPVMYDARDLTTHGVVVGMTGSGKTGLCISLLEEAAIDSIPCIIIDPKGDLTNILLQFPDLDPADFARWVNPDEAHIKGMSPDAYARDLAGKWRKGLKDSGQEPDRIKRLQDSAEWRVYTPGSEAGLPLSILQTFAAPKGNVPREALNQKIDATTTALLGLTGISADPVQSREHILIAQLLLNAWSKGKDMDLHEVITQIQAPPLPKIGAFDVETFYPEKERLKLAVALNNILAAPSFSTWIHGDPLDLGKLLSGGKKPRHLIFYVAHLDDAQRMFFITLLLEEVLSWTRKQAGTTTLRAILYFDEVYGYLPPHPANPPSKIPLMTLFKQARAFGVGVLLATQNPVDLDYKALSNAGTWFVGKLQTERDKARLLEGLEGVAAERGSLSNRSYLETVISALGNRVFLLHNIHRGKPLLFQSRHVLSFLRGPMTREQIAELMEPVKRGEAGAPHPTPPPPAGGGQGGGAPLAAILLCRHCHAELPRGATACPKCGQAIATASARIQDEEFKRQLQRVAPQPIPVSIVGPGPGQAAPKLPEDVPQFYIPLRSPARPSGALALVYQPRVLGMADVTFFDKRRGVSHRQTYRLLALPPDSGQALTWHTAERLSSEPANSPESGARWTEVPDSVNTAKKLKPLEKSLGEFLYTDARLGLLENAKLGLIGQPGEDVVAFQARCRAAAQQEADKAVAAERLRYQPKFDALGVKMPEEQPQEGGSVLNLVNPFWWFGMTSKGKSAPKGQGKAGKLEAEWLARRAAIYEKWRQVGEEYSDVPLTPRRQDVQVMACGLAWAPFWQVQTQPGRVDWVPAYR
ncbi:MAG: DUF87 domain-containing protein [Gemmataceae bacterium]|nr:DUF87 domain-containing protein [Gemmataceae bacterium]